MDSPSMLANMRGLKPRTKGAPPITMRERVAAALECSRVSGWKHEPHEARSRGAWMNDVERKYYGEWADAFLLCLDHLDLEMIDHGRENGDS